MATCSTETAPERNPFAIDLFNFLWSALKHAHGHIVNHRKSYFNDDIGYSVLYIQLRTRNLLFGILKGMQILTAEDAISVTREFCKARRSNDKTRSVSQQFLDCCAIVAEVYLYCYHYTGKKLDGSIVFNSWNLVFSRRRITELLESGGWAALRAYANNYREKISFINYPLDNLKEPYKRFPEIQTYDPETDVMAANFEEYFSDISRKVQVQILMKKEERRQMREATRMGNADDKSMGIAVDPRSLPSQARANLRAIRRVEKERQEYTAYNVSPYATSDEEDSNEDASVSELCTEMFYANLSGESEKKKPKKKKKRSHKATVSEEVPENSAQISGESKKKKPKKSRKATETDEVPENSSGSLIESHEKGSISETLTSSSRPLRVPAQIPETSPTKSETKVTSHEQSKTGRKGKSKE